MQFDLFANTIGRALGRAQRLGADVRRDAQQVADDARSLARSAADAADSVIGTAAASPRMARIAATAASIGWIYRADGARREALGSEDGASASLHRRSAVRVRELCEELRGGVLKVGQLASTRIDLLPPEWIEELSKLRDSAPEIDFAIIAERIAAELGPVEELFEELQEKALAAASIAQVHAGFTRDGDDVVVKVQVPGVDAAIAADIKALQLAARALRDSPVVADLQTTVAELGRALREELDYRVEADELRSFRERFADDARVVIPRVLDALSSERVLTMERVHGQPLSDFLQAATDGERHSILTTLVDLVCEQLLSFGRLHADPHPGNFLVTADGKLAILDFGCVATFDERARAAYAEIAMAFVAGKTSRLGELLIDMGFDTTDGTAAGIARYAEEIMAPFRDPSALAEMLKDPTKQLRVAIDMARENPIVSVPRDFVLLARVFAALGGLLASYAPDVELGSILGRHLAAGIARPSS